MLLVQQLGSPGALCSALWTSVRSALYTQNPLDKQLVADEKDAIVPDKYKGQMVVANTEFPRLSNQKAPKHIMFNIEAMWFYKHVWQGAGLYYREGDHLINPIHSKDNPMSMHKILNIYPTWDKWIMPRCERVHRFLQISQKNGLWTDMTLI